MQIHKKEYLIFYSMHLSKFVDQCSYNSNSYSKHLKIHNRIAVWNPLNKNGTKILKQGFFLLITKTYYSEVKEILDIFNSDVKFFKQNFTDFSEENYPEYFI